MSDILKNAKQLLIENNYSFVIIDVNNNITTSKETGVKHLMRIALSNGDALKNVYIADKVIGRAAASILIKNKIKCLYAHLISDAAIKLLENNNIKHTYFERVPLILNKDKTGLCPMEEMVYGLDATLAYNTLYEFFKDKV